VHYYEELGIDRFKLVDRGMVSEAIVRIVDAYTKGRYEGNLLDLMAHPSINLLASKPNLIKKFKYFFRPFAVNVFKLYKAKEVMSDFQASIDNRSLDGFIDFFLKNNCDLMSCDECGYCNEVAKKVVRINSAYQEKACRLHRNFLDELVSGEMFRY
jgi:collagenase-like PrtC family protease